MEKGERRRRDEEAEREKERKGEMKKQRWGGGGGEKKKNKNGVDMYNGLPRMGTCDQLCMFVWVKRKRHPSVNGSSLISLQIILSL